MVLEHFSRWLAQATQPSYNYYTPLQYTLAAGTGYAGTFLFTRISPIRGMALSVMAFAISQLITPYFVDYFKPYWNVPFIPLIGQILQSATSFSLALAVCNIAGFTLSFKEAARVNSAFITVDALSTFALYQYRLSR